MFEKLTIKTLLAFVTVVAVNVGIVAVGQAEGILQEPNISLKLAKRMAKAALNQCRQDGFRAHKGSGLTFHISCVRNDQGSKHYQNSLFGIKVKNNDFRPITYMIDKSTGFLYFSRS